MLNYTPIDPYNASLYVVGSYPGLDVSEKMPLICKIEIQGVNGVQGPLGAEFELSTKQLYKTFEQKHYF